MTSRPTNSKNLEQYLVGLTGNICSGKSKVAEYFRQSGAYVIDMDNLVHELYKKNILLKYELCKKFGIKILNKKIEIDRKKLGCIVLSDKPKMKELEGIVWPYALKESKKRIKGKKGIMLFEAAMLYESGFDKKMDKNILVMSDEEQQLKRLMARNGLSKEEALKRISIQMSPLDKVFKSDYIIFNNGSFDELKENVNQTWKHLHEDYEKSIYLLENSKAYKSVSNSRC